jgi:hypothetical protein
MVQKVSEDNHNTARVIVDSISSVAHRALDHLLSPQTDPMIEFLTGFVPMIPMLIQTFKPQQPVDSSGPRLKQLQREIAAEDARLSAEHAAKRARMIAKFGPRLDRASELDAEEAAKAV